jgi:hypothetical protein
MPVKMKVLSLLIPEDLEIEPQEVQYLLNDALDGFVRARDSSNTYVETAYPLLQGEQFWKKVAQVQTRKELAQVLREATPTLQIQSIEELAELPTG